MLTTDGELVELGLELLSFTPGLTEVVLDSRHGVEGDEPGDQHARGAPQIPQDGVRAAPDWRSAVRAVADCMMPGASRMNDPAARAAAPPAALIQATAFCATGLSSLNHVTAPLRFVTRPSRAGRNA